MLRGSITCAARKPLVGAKGVLQDPATVMLNNIRDVPGAKHKEKRVGRGDGSGRGGTSTRGHKGHWARAGRGPKKIFEGGQSHTALRMRKHGFTNKENPLRFDTLRLDRLQRFIKKGKLPTDEVITMKMLRDSKAISSIHNGVKLLGNGKEVFDVAINIEASAVTKGAREAIEKAGGKVTTVYMNRLSIIQHLRKKPEDIVIQFARAPRKVEHRFDEPQYDPHKHAAADKV